MERAAKREKVLCSPISITLRFTAVGGGSFRITPRLLHSKENTYGAATIRVEENQRVISTGPYAVVRHPMYTGALILMLGIPLALGSWWGLLLFLPGVAGIIWRLLDEERFLSKNLAGYTGYKNKVRYRLLPLVW